VLASLRERGVDFVEWPTKGVRTPVRLSAATSGPLRLVILERKPGGVMPVMDCELGRALLDAAASFRCRRARPLLLGHLRVPAAPPLEEALRARARPRHRRPPVRDRRRRVFDVERDFEAGVGDWATRDQARVASARRAREGRALRGSPARCA